MYLHYMINIMNDIKNLNQHCHIVYIRLSGLHPNIFHSKAIYTISGLLAIYADPIEMPQNSYVIDLIKLALENNHFEFGDSNGN